MHQQLSKDAAVKASSFDDLVKNLRDIQKRGKQFKNYVDPEALARNITYEKGGSGSIVFDSASSLLNKLTGKKKAGDIVKQKMSSLQRKLVDTDIKIGNKINTTLSKHKPTKKMSNAFVYNHDIPLASNPNGIADELVRVSVPSLTAPIEKAKNAVLPTAGALYLNSKIVDAAQNKNKGGDVMNESEYREMLKEKIATALGNRAEKTATVIQHNEEAKLFLKASNMLKIAACKQKEMETDLIKLANENKQLNHELYLIKKAEEAKIVTEMMVNKGLIKKADMEEKINELIEMDKNAFIMFKEAIQNVHPEEKTAASVDDLTFLFSSNNIEHRKTLEDSIEDAVIEMKNR